MSFYAADERPLYSRTHAPGGLGGGAVRIAMPD